MRTRRVDAVLFAIGLAFLIVWGASEFHRIVSSRLAIARFETTERAISQTDIPTAVDPDLGTQADLRLWSPKRVSAYFESLVKKTEAPLAILRVPKIGLKVPVFNGTDDLTLDRGVGRIMGTAQVGGSGNLAIAGHRDGFFRGLQDVVRGDLIELVRPQQTDTYVIRQIRIVTPEDISVLSPTSVPTLTLITCFPFYFVGHAPRRYVVTAHLKPSHHPVMAAEHAIF